MTEVEDSTKDMDVTKEGRLRDTFLFANTLQFLHLFSDEVLGIDHIPFIELEKILEGVVEGEKDSRLGILYRSLVKLLHKSSRAPSDDFISQTVSREYRRAGAVCPREVEPTMDGDRKIWPPLGSVPPMTRLQILFDLCSFQLIDVESFLTSPQGVVDRHQEWRCTPLGSEKSFNFWFLGGMCLYMEDKSNDSWSCLAWDAEGWRSFLASSTLQNSRRASDKNLYALVKDEIFPSIQEELESEERKVKALLKKEQAKLQRIAFDDTRKRSSRLVAKKRIRQDMIEEETYERRSSNRNSNISSVKRSAPLSREERMAKRDMEREKNVLDQVLATTRIEVDEVSESFDIEEEVEDGSEDSGSVVDVGQYWSSESEEGTEENEIVPSSPIKLVFKMGPEGAIKSKLYLGEESISGIQSSSDLSDLLEVVSLSNHSPIDDEDDLVDDTTGNVSLSVGNLMERVEDPLERDNATTSTEITCMETANVLVTLNTNNVTNQ